MHAVRPAAVAGRFYAADAQRLGADVDALLEQARRARADSLPPTGSAAETPGAVKMLIVPHAGYVYSGAIAARAYAALDDRTLAGIRRVVLMGPAHHHPLAALALPSVHAFETPLGRVALDLTAREQLASLPQVVVDDSAHALEHSLEVHLPFLQRRLRGFGLVPLAVGHASAAAVAEVVERLWGGSETLFVLSTDLSHFLPDAQARERDASTVARMLDFADDLGGEHACGAQVLNGALPVARRHGLLPRLLARCTSGDTAGDRQRVVGYAALALHQAPVHDRRLPAQPDLDAALLDAARHAIAGALGVDTPDTPVHPALGQPGACFVTLRGEGGALRGCIGRTEAVPALGDALQHAARAAAFDDARFAPLTAGEWPSLRIEVSVLTPSQPLRPAGPGFAAAAAALCVGVDGVTLRAPGRGRATLLPQVWQAIPRAEDFLAALIEKAGLADREDAARAWRDDFALETYRVTAVEGPALPRP